jgi:hypothetical protein
VIPEIGQTDVPMRKLKSEHAPVVKILPQNCGEDRGPTFVTSICSCSDTNYKYVLASIPGAASQAVRGVGCLAGFAHLQQHLTAFPGARDATRDAAGLPDHPKGSRTCKKNNDTRSFSL